MFCQTGKRRGYLDRRLGFLSWFLGDLSDHPGQFGRPLYLKGIRADASWPSQFPSLLPASPQPLPGMCPLNLRLLSSSPLCPIHYLLLYLSSQIPASPALPNCDRAPTPSCPLPETQSSVQSSSSHSQTCFPRMLAPAAPGTQHKSLFPPLSWALGWFP